MGEGKFERIVYGSQNKYLTGNPQITFFKMVYKRYTNFSIECIKKGVICLEITPLKL